MTDGVSLVVRAWLDEGCNPAYHSAMKRKLGREWPSLYSAVETLVLGRLSELEAGKALEERVEYPNGEEGYDVE